MGARAYSDVAESTDLVALEIAQAASFLMSNSAWLSSWIRGGMIPASITDCRTNINTAETQQDP